MSSLVVRMVFETRVLSLSLRTLSLLILRDCLTSKPPGNFLSVPLSPGATKRSNSGP